jgi:hypothetical protein
MTPLEKIEKMARQAYPPPMYCGTKKREARINRDRFVERVLAFLDKVYS